MVHPDAYDSASLSPTQLSGGGGTPFILWHSAGANLKVFEASLTSCWLQI
jgi:hypothetical protein